jgi:hypothetical protein
MNERKEQKRRNDKAHFGNGSGQVKMCHDAHDAKKELNFCFSPSISPKKRVAHAQAAADRLTHTHTHARQRQRGNASQSTSETDLTGKTMSSKIKFDFAHTSGTCCRFTPTAE